MTRGCVARQFFWDFMENLGDNSNDDDAQNMEEANFILTDWFFSGLLEIRWDPKSINWYCAISMISNDSRARSQ